jgi:hypothetical protein
MYVISATHEAEWEDHDLRAAQAKS